MFKINCKYVNITTLLSKSQVTKSQITTKQYTQTTELRRILDAAAKKLNITSLNDWYKLPTKDFPKLLKGSDQSFEKDFDTSPFRLLSSAYPEHDWLPWKFEKLKQHWNDSNNVRTYLDWQGKQLGVKQLSDWYNISSTEYINIGGKYLLGLKSSLADILAEAYPEYDWLPWKFLACPKGYWNDKANIHKFMNWASKELKIKEMSDWYKVSYNDLCKIGGKYLLQLSPSYADLLMEVYPEYDWLPWKFEKCPNKYWNNIKNVRKFMDWARKELNVKEMSDWYNITPMDLKQIGGQYLLQLKPSYVDLLIEVYPEYNWDVENFDQHPRKYWGDINNVRNFMENAAKQLNVKEMSDWYNITFMDLESIGGRYLLQLKPSYVDLLLEVFPEYNWLLWKFDAFSSRSLVSNRNRRQQYVKWMGNQLNVKEMSDWYKIKPEQIIDLKGGILLLQNHSLSKLLSTVYSEYKWDESKFEHIDIWTDIKLTNYYIDWVKLQGEKEISTLVQYANKVGPQGGGRDALTQAIQAAFPNRLRKTASANSKKSQYILKECISNIFYKNNKNALIMEEYKHPDFIKLELDYFLPEYKIAFEYQGQQHYRTIGMYNRKESVESMRARDRNKIETCKELGITLIEVPYWWDRNIESLAATIYNARPDLFDTKPIGKVIPMSPPSQREEVDNSQKINVSKEVLMTALEWDNQKMVPKGWFMTEKYDGMRFYWDGTQSYSRQGNKINIPVSMSSQLPPVALDGELWTQYGLHQEAATLMITNKQDKWNKALFWIFDAPKLDKPLEERISFLQQLKLPSFAKVVEFVKCEGKEHLKQFNDDIIAKGGEGVVLREPESMYKSGRSTSLRKYKPYFDTEVKVIKSQYPQGFICEQLNGKTVFVNSNTSEEAKSVKKGSVITVKHSGTNIHRVKIEIANFV